VIAQTLVSTPPLATRNVPRGALLTLLVDRIARFRQSSGPGIDPVVARAIEEAFESLARETRS